MDLQAWLTTLIVAVGILLFASGRLRMDLIALAMLLALYLSGVLDIDETLSGFAAPATVTLGAIYVVSGAMRRSGAAALVSNWLLQASGRSANRLTTLLLTSTAALSAFMPNLAAMVIMLPVGLRLSRAARLRPGKILLPLSLFATLGGYLTLIGTPPNLIISDLLAARMGRGFGLFEITLVGAPVVFLSLIWVHLGQRFLPDTGERPSRIGPNLRQLEHAYDLGQAFYRLRLRSHSDLAGRQLSELDFRERWQANVVGVAPPKGQAGRPLPGWTLETNDEIIVQGARADLMQMAVMHGLEPKGVVSLLELARLAPADLELAEVLVPPYSPLIGHTLAGLQFSQVYGLTVLAVLRGDEASAQRLLETPLQEGDRLLVEGDPGRLAALRQNQDLVVLSDLGVPADEVISRRSRWMLWILAGVVALSVSGLVALPVVGLLGAMAAILTRCTTAEDAYEDVDWPIVILVAGLLPLGTALNKSGVAALLGQTIVDQFGAIGPRPLLAITFFATVLLTQPLPNSVLALVMAPLAIDLAGALGVNPEAFAAAVLLGVSTAFLTPITEVNNLLVRKPGAYQFRHYLLFNLPVLAIVTLAALWLGPLIWPF